MRRITMATMALVAGLSGTAGSTPAAAGEGSMVHGMPHSAALLVQYYGDYREPYGRGNWSGRHQWQERRRARDEARIAEAARREAYEIERERADRRAWRHAQRHLHSYYRGW